MKKSKNIRSLAAKVIGQVIDQGVSLNTLLPALQKNITEKDRALLQELSFGVLRVLPQLEWYLQQLMAKCLTGKQRTLHYLLMVGLYQLLYTRIPPHAVLSETVDGATALKQPHFKGLINGVLRQFQRQKDHLIQQGENSETRYLHPRWLLQRIQQAYPEDWQHIIAANNQKPPMWIRVNRLHCSRNEYIQRLKQAELSAIPHPDTLDALRLVTPCPVTQLPGFLEGWVTVQDVAAQACTDLLAPLNGEKILDLCAAPGGKTTHILEMAPTAHVLAVDINQQRLNRVTENLLRLGLQAEIKQGDGRTPEAWCHNQQFDRILLDAPCSATGVIRRHPDIKWLRRDSDINELVILQQEILNAIWPLLKQGGTLVYATCSILPEENREQIGAFLQHHRDAKLVETGDTRSPGKQNLPDPENGDGFFYAKMIKMAAR